MRHRRLRDGTIVEISDVTHCSACGQRFEPHLFTRSWSNCGCAGGHGHRIYVCLRGTCRGMTSDPPHDGSEIQTPLEGHAH